MQKILASTISAAALMIAVGQASAADLGARPMVTKAPVMATYNWTGAYIGVNGGGAWGSFGAVDVSGGFGGGQIGYNWQTGQFVVGLETDIQFAGIDGTVTSAGIPVTGGTDWFGTVRGRIGYAWDRNLLYFTGGLAYGDAHASALGVTFSDTNTGWTIGGGLEFALTGPWTAKVEYLHIDLGDIRIGGINTGANFNADLVRAGLNYRF